MRRFFIILAGVLLMSCELTTYDNGDLDGFWQLRQVDTLATGGQTDMRQSMIYWAVQNNLLEVRQLGGEEGDEVGYLFHFELTDGMLRLSVPYRHERELPDEEVTDLEEMRPYGFDALEQSLWVVRLEKESLVLQNDWLRLYFRKY